MMILLFLQKFKDMNAHNLFEQCSKFSLSFSQIMGRETKKCDSGDHTILIFIPL